MKKLNLNHLRNLITAGALGTAATVSATTVTFQQGVSGYTGNEARMTTTFGGGTTITEQIGGSLGGLGRFISPIRFDLTSLAGQYSAINSLSLTMTVEANTLNGSGDVGLVFNNRGANSSWVETQVNANQIKTGTTWTGPGGTLTSAGAGVAPFAGSGAWDIGAANNGLPIMAQTTVSGANAVGSTLTLSFSLSATDLKKLVDIWSWNYAGGSLVNGGQTYTANPGMFFSFVSTSTYSSGDIRFRDDDAATISTRPILTVDYTPVPEPSTLALAVLGGGLVLALRRRRA